MEFVKKLTFFLHAFFLQKKARKKQFVVFWKVKNAFYTGKLISSKVKKLYILQRGWYMVFAKIPPSSYMCFFVSKQSKKETFFDILDSKECFLDLKREAPAKSKKSAFSKGVSPWFLSKNRPFSYMFF